MKYDVTVDYVTTASVFVEAANMDDAVELVSEYMRTPAGAEELLKMMAHNVPDGFDIPHVESAGDDDWCENVDPNGNSFECSKCGCDVAGGDELGANMYNGSWNRCPNCGRWVL